MGKTWCRTGGYIAQGVPVRERRPVHIVTQCYLHFLPLILRLRRLLPPTCTKFNPPTTCLTPSRQLDPTRTATYPACRAQISSTTSRTVALISCEGHGCWSPHIEQNDLGKARKRKPARTFCLATTPRYVSLACAKDIMGWEHSIDRCSSAIYVPVTSGPKAKPIQDTKAHLYLSTITRQ